MLKSEQNPTKTAADEMCGKIKAGKKENKL